MHCIFLCCIFVSIRAPCREFFDNPITLLLGSMYIWTLLNQLNRSSKYNKNIARTGISTLNGHISETVQNFEKLKKIRCNYFSILSLDRWFRNFPQCVFCHFWLIWVRFWLFLLVRNFCEPNFQEFRLK